MSDRGRPINLTPEEFKDIWEEYKRSVDETPDTQEVATGKGVFKVKIRKPYLRQGFESYVYRTRGFHIHQYIDNWKGAYDDFLGVVTYARKDWESDQIEGSLTGRYKAPNLVARLNGIVDKKEIKTEAVEQYDLSKLTDEELEFLDRIKSKSNKG